MSEEIEVTDSKKTDFVKITGGVLSSINFKIAFLIFAIGLIIFSDIFVNNVLMEIPDAVQPGEVITTKGTLLQLTFLVLGYIICDLLVQYEVL